MNDLTAVVLNWNQPDYTVRAVAALVGDGVPAARIVVVDNGSGDGSWERFTSELPSCHLVRIEENLGFARGNNVGASVLPGSSYLFVNSDAFVHRRGSVSELLRTLGDPDVGIVVPRLLNDDLTLQRSVLPATTPGVAFVRASGLSRLVPDRLQPRWGTRWDHGSSREIQCANGAVLLVQGALWSELGGFRETSFMYAEDLDLCWRAREHRRRVWFRAEAEFVHLGSASTTWGSFGRAERVGRANADMIRAHLSPFRAAVTIGTVRAGLAGRLAYRRLTGNQVGTVECAGMLRGYGASDAGEVAASPARPEIVVLRPGELAQEGAED